MSGVGDFISNTVGNVADVVGSVVQGVGDAVGNVVQAIGDNLPLVATVAAAYFSGGSSLGATAAETAAAEAAAAEAITGTVLQDAAAVTLADTGAGTWATSLMPGEVGVGATGIEGTLSTINDGIKLASNAVKLYSYLNPTTGQRVDIAPNAPAPMGYRFDRIIIAPQTTQASAMTDKQNAAPSNAGAQLAAAKGVQVADQGGQQMLLVGVALLALYWLFVKRG